MIKPKLKKYAKRLSRKSLNNQISGFLSQCPQECNVLNIGAGGEIYEVVKKNLPSKNITLVSVDIDPKRNPDILDDIVNSSIESDSFDFIICAEVLEHVENPFEAVNNIMRIVKTGGDVLISTPFIFPTHDAPYDFFRYTEFGLKKLFSNIGEITSFKCKNSYIESLMLLILRGLWLKSVKIHAFITLYFLWNIPLFLLSKLFIRSHVNNSMCSGFIMTIRK